MDYKTIITGI